jgi:predicted glycosyltransferase
MKVVITIQHPAHVHFYRNAIEYLQATGHEVHVFTRDRPMALTLLDRYGIDYEVLTHRFDSRLKMALGQLKYERNLLKRVREIDPDVITAIGGLAIAHVSRLVDAESILFTDTEHATLTNSLAFPFADTICTPDCYEDNIGPKQHRYPGYHELAYLHPDRFEPDPSVLTDIGLDPDERFVVLRLLDWKAAHDIGDSGFNDIESVVDALEDTGAKVFITAEGDIPESVARCQLPVAPEQVHHLLAYADLFIGESATMAAESAVLGTPGIYVSTIRLGYTAELEDRYDLLANFDGPNRQSEAIEAGISILDEYDQALWDRRRQRMLADKIDTTTVILEQLVGTTPTAEAPIPDDLA